MADSYILNVKPTVSASDGRKLENDLNGRFARVAKKFGGALRTIGSKLRGIIAGGAVLGIGTMMTNPIDSLNSTLDETLKKYDFEPKVLKIEKAKGSNIIFVEAVFKGNCGIKIIVD